MEVIGKELFHLSSILLYLFSVDKSQSINFNIFYKEPFVDSEKCNCYEVDNTGPSFPCNQEGQIVAIRRRDMAILSVCNITVYGGKHLNEHIL